MEHDPNAWWFDERAHGGREHFDATHAARYDAKEDAQAEEEIAYLREAGVLASGSSVIDIGAGPGQFALAVAEICSRVVAVDVSPVMLARLTEKLERDPSNVEAVGARFLTYRHAGEPADLVYSRYALHHLPDFWKAIALWRIAGMLRAGGVLRLWDVVYGFDPAEAELRIEAWIDETMAADVERGWTRPELAEHVRDEHSTYTWLLEPMIERAGFEIIDANHSASGVFARYLCRKRLRRVSASGHLCHIRGHGPDLLVAQAALVGRHPPTSRPDLILGVLGFGAALVEARADLAAGPGGA